MPLLVHSQRTEEWYAARRGKITASVAAACLGMDRYKGPLAAFREILGKRRSNNKHTLWGVRKEPAAREAYETDSGNLVQETGLWVHQEHDWLLASPDGTIGLDGLVEIKCPSKIPTEMAKEHDVQMQIQLAVTGRKWCDYYVWCGKERLLNRVKLRPDTEYLIGMLAKFYRDHILTDTPPVRQKLRTK